MLLIVLTAICVIYNIIYLIHSIHSGRPGSIIGISIMILLVIAGTVAVQVYRMQNF